MSQIKIVTDSSCGVTDEEIKKYDISIVPLSVMIDDTVYVEDETITNEEFIHKMASSKSLPKTSQPPLGKFVEMFDKLGEDGSQIISFNMLEAISGTVHTAEQAAQLSKADVTVIGFKFTRPGNGSTHGFLQKIKNTSVFFMFVRSRLGHEQMLTKMHNLYTVRTGVPGGLQMCMRFRPETHIGRESNEREYYTQTLIEDILINPQRNHNLQVATGSTMNILQNP